MRKTRCFMKKIVAVALMMTMLVTPLALVPKEVMAEETTIYQSGPYSYYFLSDGTIAIENYDYWDGQYENVTVPSKIDGKRVTAIADFALSLDKYVKTITIPEGVTTIGKDAFWNCPNLQRINLPSSVKEIGDYAFEECTSLTTVNLPSDITYIGKGLFDDCKSIKSINVPNNVTEIRSRAFSGCTNLESITLPSTIDTIGPSAFQDCASLKNITLPSKLTVLEYDLFKGCEKLSNVEIPTGVTSIEGQLFMGCKSMNSVHIPTTVERVSSGFTAFSGIKSITVQSGNKSFISKDGVLMDIAGSELIEYPSGKTDTSYSVPEGIKYIKSIAFSGTPAIESITLPSTVISASASSFQECESLYSFQVTSGNKYYSSEDGYLLRKEQNEVVLVKCPEGREQVAIPSSVKTIGSGAFNYCNKLETVDLPTNITKLEPYISNCLKSITIPASVIDIANNALAGCDNVVVGGYAGSVAEQYATERGITFVNIGNIKSYGDVDGDGFVTASDALSVLRVCVKLQGFVTAQLNVADVDQKAGVTASDALCILQKVVNLIDRFPVEK